MVNIFHEKWSVNEHFQNLDHLDEWTWQTKIVKDLVEVCYSKETIIRQESPPAWTQEAYRPPRGHSNFLLFRGGGGPFTKIFFSGLNMYQAKSGVKKFPL